MPDINQTIQNLEKKRASLVERGVRLVEERRLIAYDAHADGDQKARARLDKLNAEAATHASELASIDDALATANNKLASAQHAATTAADRQRAADLQDEFQHFVALAKKIDSDLNTVVVASNELKSSMDQIHRLGSPTPTSQRFLVLGEMALHGRLMFSAWPRGFRHLPPKDRHNLADLAAGWARSAAPSIAARLGEDQNEEAA